MRAYLREHLALGSQIIEGEITDPRSATDEPLGRHDSSVSLASTRSRSYTLTGGRLSDLFAEASANESSGEDSSTTSAEEADSRSDTLPYGSPAGLTPTPGGSSAPGSTSADVQARDHGATQHQGPAQVPKTDEEAGEGYSRTGEQNLRSQVALAPTGLEVGAF